MEGLLFIIAIIIVIYFFLTQKKRIENKYINIQIKNILQRQNVYFVPNSIRKVLNNKDRLQSKMDTVKNNRQKFRIVLIWGNLILT